MNNTSEKKRNTDTQQELCRKKNRDVSKAKLSEDCVITKTTQGKDTLRSSPLTKVLPLKVFEKYDLPPEVNEVKVSNYTHEQILIPNVKKEVETEDISMK